jgi:eukaryotic-like serine/threonine-protein kinase
MLQLLRKVVKTRYDERIAVPSSCPSEDQLVRFGERKIPLEERERIEAHLEGCESCDLSVAMLRASHVSSMQLTAQTEADLASFARRTQIARELKPGMNLGRFNLVRRVGIGAMGVVFAAYDPDLDRNVALKVLLDPSRSPEVERARIAREARSMAKLVHPNVVGVYEIGMQADRVFLAMELVVGTTLQEWLLTDPPRTEVLTLFESIAHAVGAAHDVGIIHRDLKPQNIMVTNDGSAKVTDFGLADAATKTGTLVGTPAYMSLEAIRGEYVGPASDQFSLAVCLHEALSGKRPYEAATQEALRERLVERPIVDPRIERRLRTVLERALDPSPALRFPSMSAFADALAGGPVAPVRKRFVVLGVLATAAVGSGATLLALRSAAAPSNVASNPSTMRALTTADATSVPAVPSSGSAAVAVTSRASSSFSVAASPPVRVPTRPTAPKPTATLDVVTPAVVSSDWMRSRR